MTDMLTSKLTLPIFSAIAVMLSLTFGPAVANDHKSKDADRTVAFADIFGCRGEGRLGRAVLIERPSDQGVKTVEIRIRMKQLPGMPGNRHGVHIHENAQCLPCGAAGGHFDPGPNSNSSPDGNHPFHMGDLVNIVANDRGAGKLKVLTTRITLSPGPLSVFDADGSAFIIHDFEDTFCPDGEVSGCAGGSRFACGIIEPM